MGDDREVADVREICHVRRNIGICMGSGKTCQKRLTGRIKNSINRVPR